MIVPVVFKTPDAVEWAVADLDEDSDTENEERARILIKKFVRYGECVTIDFDLEAGTATVREVHR